MKRCTDKEKELLFVTDQLPFPPRNGVTLPTYHYLLELTQSFNVKLCLFHEASIELDQEQITQNQSLFGVVELIPVYREKKLKRIWNEVIQKEAFYHGWLASKEVPSYNVNTVIVSPTSAVAKWHSTGLVKQVVAKKKIAATNDCMTAEFRLRKHNIGGRFLSKLKGRLDWLRSFGIANVEYKNLRDFDDVLLQTESDCKYMKMFVSEAIAKRVTIVPNGVNADLFSIPSDGKEASRVLFIAELGKEYAEIAQWLVTKVWPEVHKKLNDYELIVVGKGASNDLKSLMSADPSIVHIEFATDLKEIYAQSSIALSPVFKGFGLINKSLEAMAASIPVIGGLAAFNGIKSFRSSMDGVVCHSMDTREFVDAIIMLGSDQNLRVTVGESGRKLIAQQFGWAQTTDKIKKLIDNDKK